MPPSLATHPQKQPKNKAWSFTHKTGHNLRRSSNAGFQPQFHHKNCKGCPGTNCKACLGTRHDFRKGGYSGCMYKTLLLNPRDSISIYSHPSKIATDGAASSDMVLVKSKIRGWASLPCSVRSPPTTEPGSSRKSKSPL